MLPDLRTLPLTPTAACHPDPFFEEDLVQDVHTGNLRYRYPNLREENRQALFAVPYTQENCIKYYDRATSLLRRVDTPIANPSVIEIYEGDVVGNERKVLDKNTQTCTYRIFEYNENGDQLKEREVRYYDVNGVPKYETRFFVRRPSTHEDVLVRLKTKDGLNVIYDPDTGNEVRRCQGASQW